MQTRTRIVLSFAGAVAITCIVGLLAFWSAGSIRSQLHEITADVLPSTQALSDLRYGQSVVMQAAFSGRVAKSANIRQLAMGRAQIGFSDIEDARARYQALPRSAKTDPLWTAGNEAVTEWQYKAQETLDALQARDTALLGDDEKAKELAERSVIVAFAGLEGKFGSADAALGDLYEAVRTARGWRAGP
jgi:thioredoxin-like negative regulator of GroEL